MTIKITLNTNALLMCRGPWLAGTIACKDQFCLFLVFVCLAFVTMNNALRKVFLFPEDRRFNETAENTTKIRPACLCRIYDCYVKLSVKDALYLGLKSACITFGDMDIAS